jgi:hypothetical protein
MRTAGVPNPRAQIDGGIGRIIVCGGVPGGGRTAGGSGCGRGSGRGSGNVKQDVARMKKPLPEGCLGAIHDDHRLPRLPTTGSIKGLTWATEGP